MLDELEGSRPSYVGKSVAPKENTVASQEAPKGCNAIMNGWFSELSPFWPGQALSLEIDEVLHHEQTEYQVCGVERRMIVVRIS